MTDITKRDKNTHNKEGQRQTGIKKKKRKRDSRMYRQNETGGERG